MMPPNPSSDTPAVGRGIACKAGAVRHKVNNAVRPAAVNNCYKSLFFTARQGILLRV